MSNNNLCPKCGAVNREGARFCQTCGAALGAPASPVTPMAGVPVVSPPAPSPAGMPPPASAAAPPPVQAVATGGAANPPKPATVPTPQSPPAIPGTTPLVAPRPAAAQSNASEVSVTAAPTVPLSQPSSFAPLPEGALVDNRRYEVVAVLSNSPTLNAYQVVDHVGRYCTQCGSGENNPQDEFCANCGVNLSKTPRMFWLRETSEADMWEREALMTERKLWHPGLVNVYRVFQYRPYGGVTRIYLVSDAEEGEALSALPRPQPEEKVLAWGQQLAAAVGYLHSQGFRHRNIRPANIRLVGDQVKLTNFGKAEKVARAEDKDWPANEVADLARMLHDELLAGQQLSPAAAAVFAKALSTDKSVRYATAGALAAGCAEALEALKRVDSVALVAGRLSHVGMVRDHNEDSLLTLELQRTQLSEAQPVGLYVVADGMGGHEAGEVASGVAVNTVAKVLAEKLFAPWLDGATAPNYGDLLKEAFQEANQAVHERGRKARTDMGTTLVAALVIGSQAFIANIGDSRCYRFSRDGLKQVTTDHSLVERLIATGQISREEARVHPQRNYIYRTVGDKPQVDVDVFKVNLRPDDVLLLCSDGLSGMVEDPEIQAVVSSLPNPQAACEKLVQLANAAGGDDNVTVIVVQVVAANGNR